MFKFLKEDNYHYEFISNQENITLKLFKRTIDKSQWHFVFNKNVAYQGEFFKSSQNIYLNYAYPADIQINTKYCVEAYEVLSVGHIKLILDNKAELITWNKYNLKKLENLDKASNIQVEFVLKGTFLNIHFKCEYDDLILDNCVITNYSKEDMIAYGVHNKIRVNFAINKTELTNRSISKVRDRFSCKVRFNPYNSQYSLIELMEPYIKELGAYFLIYQGLEARNISKDKEVNYYIFALRIKENPFEYECQILPNNTNIVKIEAGSILIYKLQRVKGYKKAYFKVVEPIIDDNIYEIFSNIFADDSDKNLHQNAKIKLKGQISFKYKSSPRVLFEHEIETQFKNELQLRESSTSRLNLPLKVVKTGNDYNHYIQINLENAISSPFMGKVIFIGRECIDNRYYSFFKEAKTGLEIKILEIELVNLGVAEFTKGYALSVTLEKPSGALPKSEYYKNQWRIISIHNELPKLPELTQISMTAMYDWKLMFASYFLEADQKESQYSFYDGALALKVKVNDELCLSVMASKTLCDELQLRSVKEGSNGVGIVRFCEISKRYIVQSLEIEVLQGDKPYIKDILKLDGKNGKGSYVFYSIQNEDRKINCGHEIIPNQVLNTLSIAGQYKFEVLLQPFSTTYSVKKFLKISKYE